MIARRFAKLSTSLAVLFFIASATRADDANRVSATVRGHAVMPADEVSIELTVSSSAEAAENAEKSYKDKLARILAALRGEPKESEPKRARKKPSDDAKPVPSKAEGPDKKKKPAASDDDDDEEAPRHPTKATPPKPPKPAASSDDDDDAPAPPKKKPPKTDDKKDSDPPAKAGGGDAKKDDGKKDDAPKTEKKDEEKPAEPAAPKKDEPKIEVEIKEGQATFGIKQPGDPNQIRMRRMMNQPAGAKEEPEIRFASTVTVTFKDVSKVEPRALRRKFAELIDKATAEGAEIGLGADGDNIPATVRFACTKLDELKRRAYEDAMRQAHDRCADLAKLAGRELGKVIVVRDNTPLPQGVRRSMQPYTNPYQYLQFVQQQGEDVTMEVNFDCDVYVEFELK